MGILLMMTAQKFVFNQAGWLEDRKTAFFDYQIITDAKTFSLQETLVFPSKIIDSEQSANLLRALHLALGISYYKSFIPSVIEQPYKMSDLEAEFWNTVYAKGLGEFLYKNKISASQLAKFRAQDGIVYESGKSSELGSKAILGIGGGKDSIVAGELLKEASLSIEGFVMATGEVLGQTKEVAQAMQVDLLVVNRHIDKQILEINQLSGAYNGHVPVSLIFALVGSMLAVSNNTKYVIVANEASSSIPQATWENSEINHQWSKSIEFERLFQDYLHAYVDKNLHYFSAIRPLSSVVVAKIFSNYEKYFEIFTSDNSLFKINPNEREHPRWSRSSSKSLSSFILLSPWISKEDMMRIFGHNFLDDANLEQLFLDILGATENSVLDCVGTPEELRYSLAETIEQGKFTETYLVKLTREKGLLNLGESQKLFELQDDCFPDELSINLVETLRRSL